MTPGSFRFGQFVLDCSDRQLLRGGEPVDINSRYLDALGLLVREQGRLVSKDRFLDEVWRGVPVTDEALTQCIRTLRRQLGDDVSSPRFIETVPKHGYRFIAAVEENGSAGGGRDRRVRDWRRVIAIGSAATVGGGVAGFLGGLVYGFAAASRPEAGAGALSVLLVVQCLTILVGVMGGAGVGFGIAAAGLDDWRGAAAGGAAGGVIVGALVKLLGIDAFHLLFGGAPAGITGGMEGLLLGAAVGVGAWFAHPPDRSLRRGAAGAALAGGLAGLVIPLLGGRLMGGSLDLLAHTFPGSRLRLDGIPVLLGDHDFGMVTRLITGMLEGALFAGCIAIAVRVAIKGGRPLD